MTTATLNSGAINEVSFPLSESGLSLVEMTAVVSATATISSIYLSLTVGAPGVAQARTAEAYSAARMKMSATANPKAVASAGIELHRATMLEPVVAAAITSSPTVGVRRLLSATSPAAAAVKVVAVVKVRRSAATVARSTSLVSGRTIISLGAQTTPSAISDVFAIRKIIMQAAGSGRAASTASSSAKFRIGATAQASAVSGGAGIVFKILRSAIVAARALWQVQSRRNITMRAETGAVATSVANPISRIHFSASARGSSSGVTSLLIYVPRGATVTATAIGQSVAADYTATAPAPEERRMIVSASNRQMEVESQ